MIKAEWTNKDALDLQPTATDCISRQAAIDAVYDAFCYAYCDNCEKEMNEDLCEDCHKKYQNWSASKKIIEKVINNLPSAPTVEERPTGEWVLHNENFKTLQYHTCSNCGARARTILTNTRLVDNYYCYKCEPITEYEFDEELSDFCPKCGADMRGDTNEEPSRRITKNV